MDKKLMIRLLEETIDYAESVDDFITLSLEDAKIILKILSRE